MPENSLCQYQQSAGPWGLHATPEQFPLKGALRAQIPRSLSTLQVTEGSRWARRTLSGNLGWVYQGTGQCGGGGGAGKLPGLSLVGRANLSP